MKGLARLGAAVALVALISACGATRAAPTGSSLRVFVGIVPQKYFVERVGGSRVTVEALVQPGQDPHTYEPTPRQVAGLAEAKIYFQIGLSFENALVDRIASIPGMRVVDTREGITLRPVDEGGAADRDLQDKGGMDPHIWMDPSLVERQIQTIRDALIEVDPAGRASYQAGYDKFSRELDSLDREIATALASYRGREILVYHPAFGYFADAYSLKEVAVETGGKEPSARQIAGLIELARSRGVRVVFVQPQYSQAGARAVAEAIGGAVVAIDDLAYDYVANFRQVAQAVAAALGRERSSP